MAFAVFAKVEEIDILITDKEFKDAETLRALDIEVVLV
jgi:DeoR/GlpR family transcriptional regulator of sugar metabolism